MNSSFLGAIIFVLGIIFFPPLLRGAEVGFFPSRVGCFTGLGKTLGIECTEQRIAMKALKTLYQSSRPQSKENLSLTLDKRSDYFLAKKEFDYFVVIAYMLYKTRGAKEKLDAFGKLPGKRAPFVEIALSRLHNERSPYCVGKSGAKGLPIFLREICTISIEDI